MLPLETIPFGPLVPFADCWLGILLLKPAPAAASIAVVDPAAAGPFSFNSFSTRCNSARICSF